VKKFQNFSINLGAINPKSPSKPRYYLLITKSKNKQIFLIVFQILADLKG